MDFYLFISICLLIIEGFFSGMYNLNNMLIFMKYLEWEMCINFIMVYSCFNEWKCIKDSKDL